MEAKGRTFRSRTSSTASRPEGRARHADFLSVLDSAKRIQNITEGHGDMKVDPARLEHPTEKRLNELADLVGSQVQELIAGRQYRTAFESFAAMAAELGVLQRRHGDGGECRGPMEPEILLVKVA
jgi:hypothetical protein